ncbi:hypothetical protein MYX04_08545 [Nitrospiraceae bacterium AH_259_D15_M11_P09]|nr:hypothetical protein [Nitrospiraceae bacterium AH_259_D15_M11_P09]
MTLLWKQKHSKDKIALIAMTSVAAVLTAAVALAGGNQVPSNPELTAFGVRTSDRTKVLGLGATALQYTVFTSKTGDVSFEGPKDWVFPLNPHDPTREAFFVGLINQTRRTVVFLAVSRYPRVGASASVEGLIAQLRLDRDKQIDTNEAILVDQGSARLLTIEERAAVPLWGQEIVNLASVSASSSFRMDRTSTCWSMSRRRRSTRSTCPFSSG